MACSRVETRHAQRAGFFHACTSATRGPAASQSQSASAVCCKEGAPPRGSIFTKRSQQTKSFINEGVICEGCFTQRLRCRWLQSAWQLAQIATGLQAALHDDYLAACKYSKEAMQFCRSKRQQAGLQSPPGFPAILCYCRDRAVRASVLFLASPHFTDASCIVAALYSPVFTGNAGGAVKGAVSPLHLSHGSRTLLGSFWQKSRFSLLAGAARLSRICACASRKLQSRLLARLRLTLTP